MLFVIFLIIYLNFLDKVIVLDIPCRTPCVNQCWAIVNASHPCNIFCSLSRLKFASFKRKLTAQKTNFQRSWWRRKENERLWSACGFDPRTELYFCSWSISDHCKIRLDTSLASHKIDMNQSMTQQWWGIAFILAQYWNSLGVRYGMSSVHKFSIKSIYHFFYWNTFLRIPLWLAKDVCWNDVLYWANWFYMYDLFFCSH